MRAEKDIETNKQMRKGESQAEEKTRKHQQSCMRVSERVLYFCLFVSASGSFCQILRPLSIFFYKTINLHRSLSIDLFSVFCLPSIVILSTHTHTRFPGPVQFRYLISDRKAREKIWARICTPAFCQHKNSVLANIEVGKEKNLPNTESMIAFFSIEIENISILTEINETLLLGNTRYFANTQGNAYQRKVRTERGLHPIEIVLITIIMLRACEHMLQFVYPIALWR